MADEQLLDIENATVEGQPTTVVQMNHGIDYSIRCLAYHEAGHAVVGHVFGMGVARSRVIVQRLPGDRWAVGGQTKFTGRMPAPLRFAAFSAAGQQSHLRYLRLSGLLTAAEARAADSPHDMNQCAEDLMQAGHELDLHGSRGLSWPNACDLADQMLEEFWSEVEAVANDLIEYQDIDRKAIHAHMNR